GATYGGLTFNSGASAFTIGGNSFTLSGNITNNSASLQTINTGMTISTGHKTLAGGAGGLTLGGTTTHTHISATGAGLVITGTVNSTGSFTEDGGASNNSGYLAMGGAQTLNVTAGTFSVLGTTNATKPLSAVGHNAGGTSNLNVSGGNLVIGSETGFALANASTGTGVLTISSTGTATINRGTLATTGSSADTRLIMMGKDGANTGIINLNGGTLATDRQFVRDGSSGGGAGTANFVFGGGTLKALGTQPDWLQSTTASSAGQNQGATGGTLNANAQALTSVTTTAVSTIDSNGFAVGVNNAISGAGGFNIISSTGAGTVTFGGANTYTGATAINGGTLAVTGTMTGTGALTVNSPGALGGIATLPMAVTVNNGGTIAPGVGGAGTLTLSGGLMLNTGAVLRMDLAGTATSDKISVSGAFAASGTTTLNLTALGSFAGSGAYPLITGATGISASNFALGTTPSGYVCTLSTSSGTLTLTVMTVVENWRSTYFGTTANSGNAADSADPDGDGMTNAQEFAAGTDPTNAASVLKVTNLAVSGNDFIVSFSTVSGKTYRVERSDTLEAGSWTTVQGNIAGTGGTVQVTDPGVATQSKRFYRIVTP
ncbi:MAG: autotransporter-associated beta strand repeat-containing protein, partial [Luteolibacter sp.]